MQMSGFQTLLLFVEIILILKELCEIFLQVLKIKENPTFHFPVYIYIVIFS